ncbi:STAGA complex 65 subunit gamma [Strongylocentrotus purpuratus]|uniref:STAGA complex 65 subunit gamma n=1 Tax=Strongylocentrotus purpuratus TaxID=7668 RepID=A0A7M7N8X1_STRPU|nr:STAGA complex 65 subunit gamma [Strongylocentrotus purpuratus]XP_030833008.1 STAGA complex 65 subunit gamma [Strongylocentrotus purpuratus]|eukprot:XP_003730163.1 PREDICTED: STAGA complex 65 subunit gamma [Strongylocentrotus purpuratus]
MSGHWGEMSGSIVSPVTSSVVDMEALAMKSQSVQVKVPHLHQPSAQQKPQVHQLQSELCRPDVTSLHSIDLLKHCRQIRTRMLTHQHQQESSKGEDRFSSARLPPLPPQPQVQSSDKSSIPVVTGLRERPGCPRLKLADGSIEIDAGTARQLSCRAVATICSHNGYDSSQESSLETLSDVLQEFLCNTCKLLRVAVDREAHTGHTGFQDTLSQVFHEIGVGSTQTLINFWKTRIQDYHDRILKQTEEIREKYEDMKNPNYQSQDDKSPRVKEEPMSDASFHDPQSQPKDDVAENHSETSSSETPSNQPLSFHGLGGMDLDDSGGAVTVVEAGERGEEGVVDESSNEWYAGVKEEDNGEDVGSTAAGMGGVKRELMSGDDENSQDVKIEETVIGESPLGSQLTTSHTLDVDTTSPVEKKIHLNMPPRKKKKK